MKTNEIIEGEMSCLTVDGKFDFKCSQCRHHSRLTVPENKRRLHIKCACGYHYFVNLNRRRHSRSPVKKNNARMIISKKSSFPAKIINYSFGGYGVQITKHHSKRLHVGDSIVLQYYLNNTQCVDNFLVRSIDSNRLGLQYADKKFFSPKQRMIAQQNKARKEFS